MILLKRFKNDIFNGNCTKSFIQENIGLDSRGLLLINGTNIRIQICDWLQYLLKFKTKLKNFNGNKCNVNNNGAFNVLSYQHNSL